MDVAGLLLTGGRSRRMGVDKATLVPPAGGSTLAARTAALLRRVAEPALEVGPGFSGLPAVADDHPGAGPLAAVAAGRRALAAAGWQGSALVVATDLPLLDAATLAWLAGHPSPRSVVPVAGGRSQPLCARWSAADLDRAAGLVAGGRRSMADLVAAADPVLVAVGDPGGAGGAPFADADTPADARRLGLAVPAGADGHGQ